MRMCWVVATVAVLGAVGVACAVDMSETVRVQVGPTGAGHVVVPWGTVGSYETLRRQLAEAGAVRVQPIPTDVRAKVELLPTDVQVKVVACGGAGR